MTRGELDSLIVVRSGDGAELRNESGFVAWFPDRDEAYAEVRRLRSQESPAARVHDCRRWASDGVCTFPGCGGRVDA